MREVADYIIVGAGSAGCVLANRLVSAGHTVILLEAGPVNRRWDYRVHMPAALSHVLRSDAYNWYYSSDPEPWMNHRSMYCPRGRTLGGSSSINGMIFVRGNAADFNRWAEISGFPEWDYVHCLPSFKRAESASAGSDDFRGRSGPLYVTRGKCENPLFHAFLGAAGEAGYPLNEDMNGEHQEGFGPFDRTIYRGKRWSAADAYLRPLAGNSKMKVKTGALITRIDVRRGHAESVQFRQRGRMKAAYADKEILVCAGAINSPQLLMLSGIGDGDHLKMHKIPVVQHLPGVGRNLQDHLEVYVQYACQQPVSLAPALKWYNQARIGLQWYLFRKGMGATNHFEAGGFIKSDDSVASPDLQYHFLPVAMSYDGSRRAGGHGFQVHTGPMKPTSRGYVRLASADPASPPVIRFNYNATEDDRLTMRRAIDKTREIIAQPAFDEYRSIELAPGHDVVSDYQIDQFVRRYAESAYHPSCTCKMGRDDMSVVDGEGKVYGVESLRVVDASIMPEITNGNLNAPVIMIAEKIAASITAG